MGRIKHSFVDSEAEEKTEEDTKHMHSTWGNSPSDDDDDDDFWEYSDKGEDSESDDANLDYIERWEKKHLASDGSLVTHDEDSDTEEDDEYVNSDDGGEERIRRKIEKYVSEDEEEKAAGGILVDADEYNEIKNSVLGEGSDFYSKYSSLGKKENKEKKFKAIEELRAVREKGTSPVPKAAQEKKKLKRNTASSSDDQWR